MPDFWSKKFVQAGSQGLALRFKKVESDLTMSGEAPCANDQNDSGARVAFPATASTAHIPQHSDGPCKSTVDNSSVRGKQEGRAGMNRQQQ